MKKKIILLIYSLVIALSVTACSKEEVNKELVNMFDEISEEDLVDGAEVEQIFREGLAIANAENNITISVENDVIYGEGDTAEKSNYNTHLKIANEDDKKISSIEMSSVINEESSKIVGFFDNDKFYFTVSDGTKVMEDMTYDTFIGVIDNYSLVISLDSIDKAAIIEDKDGSKELYIQYDAVKLEKQMQTNLEAEGEIGVDGETLNINYSNVYAKLDKDNNLLNYSYIVDANYTMDSESVPYKYTLATSFTDRGNTSVDKLDNPQGYMSTEEYSKYMTEQLSRTAEESNSDTAID